MNMLTNFSFEAVSCLLAQDGLQPSLRTLAIRIANVARLLVKAV
jgi:hypothetical protein